MKELVLVLPKNDQPVYRRLADAIRNAIREGKIKPTESLPSSRKMAQRFGIHRHTVMNAVGELEAEGWIEAHPKKSYQVTATLPSTYLRPSSGVRSANKPSEQEPRFARTCEIGDYVPHSTFKIPFPSGAPDLRLFPLREFKSHLYDALGTKGVLSYGNPVGHEKLISQIAEYLRRIRGVSDREIIVTNGSQEAIFLLAQLFVQKGDAVAVEALAYPPAVEAIRFAGAKLIPIGIDSEGLKVDELEKHAKRGKIRLLYLTPLHQYPTTVNLSASRRLKLYEVASRYGIQILEDDYDHEFHYVSQPTAPMAAFDPARIISYVSTFSKILFPSSRLGFMAVTPQVAKEAAKLKRITSRENTLVFQMALANWMESGGFERHLRKMRRTYAERRDEMLRSLEGIRREHWPNLSWTAPDGGMALWLDLGQDSGVFAERLLRKGVLVNAERDYCLSKPISGTHLRLGFSAQTPIENRRRIEEVFERSQ